MKEEHSAGGIIVKHTDGAWHVLVINDMNNILTFPKGIIELNEQAEEAAKREIQEEVGITELEYVAPLPQISYWYVRDGAKIHKTVSYFVFKTETTIEPVPQREEGITAAHWLKLSNALHQIGYKKTNIPLLQETAHILN